MKYPVELYCACGTSAKYPFLTQGAHDEYLRLWALEHTGKGHGQIPKKEFTDLKKRKEQANAS